MKYVAIKPLSLLLAIGFCLLSFSIILLPIFILKFIFKIDIPMEYSIWFNIPGFLIPAYLIYKNSSRPFLNLFKNKNITSIKFWLISSITCIGLLIFLGEVENYILYFYPISNELYSLMETLLSSSSGILAATIMAPFTEEVFFRGAMLNGFIHKYSKYKSILLSAFLFGIIHLNPWQFIPAFLAGIFFGWIFIKTGNIWLCMFLHFLNNSMAVLFEFTEIKVEGLIYDPRLGVEFQPYWLTFIGLLIFIFGIKLLKNIKDI